jgi:uncharacterized protein YdeI (YjbR/CyaY-like superfamily)
MRYNLTRKLIWDLTNVIYRNKMKSESMNKVYITNRTDWREWLEANHNKAKEIWLVFNKKETELTSIPYDEAVEEALCFGWIDSIIKKLDESQYARKFTPRKADSKWSVLNIQRVEKMIRAGLMTPHGMDLVQAAKQHGKWDKPNQKPVLNFQLQPEFMEALRSSPKAQETFDHLAPTYQKQYIGWVEVAKRADTKQKRIAESVRLLEQGKKLGLK